MTNLYRLTPLTLLIWRFDQSKLWSIKSTYDTIRKKSLTWTQKLSDQLNLAHVARKNMKKKKLK